MSKFEQESTIVSLKALKYMEKLCNVNIFIIQGDPENLPIPSWVDRASETEKKSLLSFFKIHNDTLPPRRAAWS